MTRRVLVLLMLALGVGGCATAGSTVSVPPVGPVVTAPTSGPTLAPRVPVPRDARGIPVCDLLTSVQLSALDVDPGTGEPEMVADNAGCQWRTRDGTSFLHLSSATNLPVGGLEGLYLVRRGYEVFEPGDLDGFPTVRANRSASRDTSCTFYVGVADDQLVWATAGFAAGQRSACATARQMASYMLSNLPPLR